MLCHGLKAKQQEADASLRTGDTAVDYYSTHGSLPFTSELLKDTALNKTASFHPQFDVRHFADYTSNV